MIRRFRTETAPIVEFIQHHQPPLDSGIYKVEVQQKLSIDGGDEGTWRRSLTFVVSGERFSTLAPEDISGVFPPAGALGDYRNVLCHISLKRSTLPWERSPDDKDHELPWLALLVFHDRDFADPEERPTPQSITLGELLATTGSKFPKIRLEPGQTESDGLTVIDVKKRHLAAALPTKSELGLLAHVRNPKDESGNALGQQATVFSNRLPQEGGTSTAFLVSMEGRYREGGEGFDFQGAGDDDLIRLVMLASWRFSCKERGKGFTQLLTSLDVTPDTLRLPDSGNAEADRHLAQGYVPMPHALRQGDQTVSWYHGPMSPCAGHEPVEQPYARSADQLVRYEERTGMFDVSYAAAWQLGRALTLENQPVALALYRWHRAAGLAQRQAKQRLAGIPLRAMRTKSQRPEEVERWFDDLGILKGVPFEYLVPDERLLPVESIRFFRLDPRWMMSLLDGAYSIGLLTDGDVRRAQRRSATSPAAAANGTVSGFLLRSEVVSGWPDLLVDGYSAPLAHRAFQRAGDPRMDMLRMERLSPNVLLCLFDGEVKTVDIHLKPEAMRFGVDDATGNPPRFRKTMRDKETGAEDKNHVLDLQWRGAEALGVIDIAKLAGQMGAARRRAAGFTSAPFALQMIEGVQKVRFTPNPAS